MIKSVFISIFLICLVSSFFDSCQSYQLEKKLDPESREFISIARYIMTSEEHSLFFKLTDVEREKFIEDFWKRRDPDPYTKENEFKEVYLSRIDKANELFHTRAGGDLTDRGMIYVIFGPPNNIYSTQGYSRGISSDQEMWYYIYLFDKYNDVRVYFIDRLGTGNFELDRRSSVFSLIQAAKTYYLEQGSKEKFFRYDIKLKKLDKKDDKVDLLIQIKVPYKNIWFSEVENKMETTLSLDMKILDASKNKIWEHKEDYFLSFSDNEVKELSTEKYVIEITTTISKGKYSLNVSLTNTSGGEDQRVIQLKI